MKYLITKIFISCLITAVFIKWAYMERGYLAFGSEWLVLPTWLLLSLQIKSWIRELRKDR